jgi:MFS family permease
VALSGGILGLAGFLLIERYVKSPMVPLEIFRSRTFSGANALTFLLYAALGGTLFFLPFNLIQVHGYTPAQSGAALLPLIVLMALLSGWSGRFSDRHGARPSLIVGPLIAAVGYGLLALPGAGGSYWTTFLLPVTVLGLGMVVTVAPLTTTVMGSVGRGRAGVASGVNNAVSRAGSLLAIAVLSLVAFERFGSDLGSRLTSLGLPLEVRRQLGQEQRKLAAASIPSSLSPELQHAVRAAIGKSFVEAFRVISLLAAGLALAASVIAWALIREGPRAKREG